MYMIKYKANKGIVLYCMCMYRNLTVHSEGLFLVSAVREFQPITAQ